MVIRNPLRVREFVYWVGEQLTNKSAESTLRTCSWKVKGKWEVMRFVLSSCFHNFSLANYGVGGGEERGLQTKMYLFSCSCFVVALWSCVLILRLAMRNWGAVFVLSSETMFCASVLVSNCRGTTTIAGNITFHHKAGGCLRKHTESRWT